jgi:hypothetical protein
MELSFDDFVSSFNAIKKHKVKAKIYLESTKLVMPRPKGQDVKEESKHRSRKILDRIWPLNRE